MEADLKACPFCGYKVPALGRVLRQGYENQRDDPEAYRCYIICHHCGCQGPPGTTEGAAKSSWQRRPLEEGFLKRAIVRAWNA